MKGKIKIAMAKTILVHWKEQLEELELGAVDIIPKEDFEAKLRYSYKHQIPLNVKWGADPSRSDMHLGHGIILRKLRMFQDFGHKVCFLIGDFTAMIGDPTGQSKTRPLLTREEVKTNAKTYREQAGKILDMDKIHISYNSDWHGKLFAVDLIGIMAKTTVNHLSNREDFSNRLKEGLPVHLHEFVYPIVQGYDSVAMKSDVEVGGTDQLFNLLMGRNLQGALGEKHKQVVFTLPLLEGIDGVQKMSKSFGNAISFNETPEDIFGKVMSISDELMIRYYKLISRKEQSVVEKTIREVKEGTLHPMEAKKQLAFEITSYYHPLEVAHRERDRFEKRFSRREMLGDIKTIEVIPKEFSLIDCCMELGWVRSKKEFRRLIKQQAVKINGEKYDKEVLMVEKEREYFFQVGKLRMIKIISRVSSNL